MTTATKSAKWERAQVIINDYKKHPTTPLMLLQDIQDEYGYLPPEPLEMAAAELNIPLAKLYGLATFYRAFSLEARGRHKVKVCMGTACVVRGAQGILEGFLRELNIDGPGATEDEMFSLEAVNCVGACALGPVVVIDGEYYGHMTQALVKQRAEAVRAAERENPAQSPSVKG